jgi:hypothetical protein
MDPRWVLGLMLCVGCADQDEGSYASGLVADNDVMVGVAWIESGAVVAYACGGEETLQDWTHWFDGSVTDDSFALSNEGWTLTGAWSGASWSGDLSGPEGQASWSAQPGEASLVGIYESGDGGCTAGVVVTEIAGELTSQGAWCEPESGVLRQVTPVNLGLEDGGIPVKVEADDGLREFSVTLVSP